MILRDRSRPASTARRRNSWMSRRASATACSRVERATASATAARISALDLAEVDAELVQDLLVVLGRSEFGDRLVTRPTGLGGASAHHLCRIPGRLCRQLVRLVGFEGWCLGHDPPV